MKLSLKNSLFIGFCAVFILVAKAAFRLHLKIPGHAMFFTMFFLLLARGCVRYRLAATFTGLMAGVMTMLLGMGKGGPLLLIKYLLPGLAVDVMAFMLPGLFESVVLCIITAIVAGSMRFFSTALIDFLVGMDFGVLIQHALIQAAGNILFAMAGAAMVPHVIKKLRAYGVITEAVPDCPATQLKE